MESEKVKEIKEALAQNSGYIHFFNEYEVLDDVAYTDILTLINELEHENERLVESCKNCHYIKDLEIANGHTKQLKDRIAELENEIKENAFYSKGYAQGIKNTYEIVVPDKLKQFTERLKKMAYKSNDWSHGEHPLVVEVDYIDEVLEEFIKDVEVEE